MSLKRGVPPEEQRKYKDIFKLSFESSSSSLEIAALDVELVRRLESQPANKKSVDLLEKKATYPTNTN